MLRLPEPDHRPLQNVALPLVVAQARFSSVHAELDREMLSRFQFLFEEAGLHTPRVNPLQMNQVIVGPTPEPVMSRTNGYQLVSANGEWTVTITSDSIALETPAFHELRREFPSVVASSGGRRYRDHHACDTHARWPSLR